LLYVPTVSLQAQASQVLARGGEGSSEPETGMPAIGSGLQDNAWFVGAGLSYPIFSGFSRRINKQRTQVQLDQLDISNTNLDQNLELSIRASTVSLLSATTNLSFSRQSAESATKNFKLIQNNYKEGAVNITQVIDAQQAALNAQFGAAISVYEFILANLQIEYSVGFFSMFSTEEDLEDFQNRFLEYISNNTN
jgi:outer membrane protein TolC